MACEANNTNATEGANNALPVLESVISSLRAGDVDTAKALLSGDLDAVFAIMQAMVLS